MQLLHPKEPRAQDAAAAEDAVSLESCSQRSRGASRTWIVTSPTNRRAACPRRPIGGADADFITGGLLIGCKATTRPHKIGRAEVQQLAGYLLLDCHHTYGIDRVGFYLSCQGALITWTVPDFLTALGTTTPLPHLRRLLQQHLASGPMKNTRD
ncbi:hypothetical protein [Streptomyces sp. NPDC058268]|uniref:hypothetical protein n=1 Tax=Streptomyces sp. NPDC058268 TaxID=3346413 RepID=UPI0036E8585E